MNLENLQEKQMVLVKYMESNNYSSSYVSAVLCEIRWLIKNKDAYTWNSYEEALQDRAGKNGKKTFSCKKSLFLLIKRFEEDSVFPNRTRQHEGDPDPYVLCGEFENLAESFEEMEAQRPIKTVTVKKNIRCFRSFLRHLKIRGCEKTCDVTEEDSISYFRDESGNILRGYTAKRIISHAFIMLSKNGFPECKRLLSFIPLLKYHHKNVQYLKDDEVAKIINTLKGKEGRLSLRNRAIGLLLVYTGMRASDIASLKKENIDWEKEEINCIQQKTGVPLHLPLLPVIGNAIYNYITLERPESSSDRLFLSTRSAGKLTPSSICSISSAIYKASSVRSLKGDRKGTHIFRHHLVTAMLSNGADQATISQTVGHSDPNSLAPYLHADIENLRDCSLDVSMFPISRKECQG